jgi:AcrR family transcriptional regulator
MRSTAIQRHIAALDHVASAGEPWPLAVLLAGDMGPILGEALRTSPRQARSMQTIDRLFHEGFALAKREADFDSLTLEAVAHASNVTPQSAYRYFANMDKLFFFCLRRIQTLEYVTLTQYISAEPTSSIDELSDIFTAFVVRANSQTPYIVPTPRMQRQLLQRGHEIAYRMAHRTAEIIANRGLARDWEGAKVTCIGIESGLVSAASLAKRFLIQDLGALSTPSAQRSIGTICRSAMLAD